MWVFRVCLVVLWGGSAAAQDHVVPEGLLDVASQLHRPMADVAEALSDVVPQFQSARSRPVDVPGDPFFAVLDGVFGVPGDVRPAGLVHCARYGVETRTLLASRPASDPEVFPVFSALRVAGDDAARWPEDAIALFRCSLIWDDARRVAPWPEAVARSLVAPNFRALARMDDVRVLSGAGEHIQAQFGPDGYRLTGTDGPRESYYWLESLTVSRELRHQRITFRAFLLGGLA